MENQFERHVFISYVRENSEQVQRLCEDLSKHGVKVWLDRNEIKPGQRWQDAIRQAIREGNFFIACFSSEYRSRPKSYMNEELTLAIDELRKYVNDQIWFIPVLLSECDVPDRSIGAGDTLLDIHWVPLYENWEIGLKKILSVIKPIPLELQNLINVLNSVDNEIRDRAAETLGKMGDPLAIPPLIRALDDKDEVVRGSAAEALGKIGEQSAVPGLIKALTDNSSYVRYRVAGALGDIGSSEAVPHLVKAIADEYNIVRQWAADALGDIGDPQAIPCLFRTLTDQDEEEFVRDSAAEALANIGVPAITQLIKVLTHKNSYVRGRAALALGKIGDPEIIPELKEKLNDKDGRVRHQAIDALGMIGNPAINALKEALNNEDSLIRGRAAFLLDKISTQK